MKDLHLSFDSWEPREIVKPDCPNAAEHVPQPISYGGFFDWCRHMARTHVQRRCPGCQRYTLWAERVPCSECGRSYAPISDGTPRSHRSADGRGRCAGAHRAAEEVA